ncbi:hypothetical protein EZS27_019491 [termite gut metagenome]|uniref:DUF3298 domain-containing protein n=1 Tax=termite gut metagenome TaxID=433724 RepID=A0A5J4RFI5_9ZZZZ
MKRGQGMIVVRFVSIVVITVLFISCNAKKKEKILLEFNAIQLTETEHLFGDTTNPACRLTIDYTYLVESSQKELSDTLNNYFITACFGSEYTKEKSIEDVLNSYAKTYMENYRKDTEPIFLQDNENQEIENMSKEWYFYTENIVSKVQFCEGNLLVYRVDKDNYNGGAHGIYLTYFLNMGLTKKSPLSLNDIFKGDSYKELLTDLLWNQLMADNQVTTREELEEMGYGTTGDLVPSENFYLNKEGITFYYNVYEFAPYVMGPLEIRLPYESIEQITVRMSNLIN